MKIAPWDAPFDTAFAADLRQRLRQARWSDAAVDDWRQGTAAAPLRELVGYWQDRYDWAGAAARINALPHFRATIDGASLHFLHSREKGRRRSRCC